MIEISENGQKTPNHKQTGNTNRGNNSNKKNLKKGVSFMANTESYMHMTHAEMDDLILSADLKNVRTKGGRLVSGLKVALARELITQLKDTNNAGFKAAYSAGVMARIKTGQTSEDKAVKNLEDSDAKEVVSKLSPKAKAALLKALK